MPMIINDLLTAERVVCNADVGSKKRALELLGELIATAAAEIEGRTVFDVLVGRERLGSTGLGQGVALPHGRSEQSSKAVGAFIKIAQGIDFDAPDRQPVNLVFALLVPEHFTDEHLKILAYLAEMFSDRTFCERLMASDSDAALYHHLIQWQPH